MLCILRKAITDSKHAASRRNNLVARLFRCKPTTLCRVIRLLHERPTGQKFLITEAWIYVNIIIMNKSVVCMRMSVSLIILAVSEFSCR